ncbi:hypothetical protein [Paenibacillus phytorum]|uniref:hypothetical protein n=1 Tax=Paenibacillus phytorum TaxID=2654977 RepID=UPI001491742E|nr:hypothetical protein [Paenibacillus phytorum]
MTSLKDGFRVIDQKETASGQLRIVLRRSTMQKWKVMEMDCMRLAPKPIEVGYRCSQSGCKRKQPHTC